MRLQLGRPDIADYADRFDVTAADPDAAMAVTWLGMSDAHPIDSPVRSRNLFVPPARAVAYRCGEAWSTFINHTPSNRRLLIQGTVGFVPGALAGRQAEVAYLGVGQLGVQPER